MFSRLKYLFYEYLCIFPLLHWSVWFIWLKSVCLNVFKSDFWLCDHGGHDDDDNGNSCQDSVYMLVFLSWHPGLATSSLSFYQIKKESFYLARIRVHWREVCVRKALWIKRNRDREKEEVGIKRGRVTRGCICVLCFNLIILHNSHISPVYVVRQLGEWVISSYFIKHSLRCQTIRQWTNQTLIQVDDVLCDQLYWRSNGVMTERVRVDTKSGLLTWLLYTPDCICAG